MREDQKYIHVPIIMQRAVMETKCPYTTKGRDYLKKHSLSTLWDPIVLGDEGRKWPITVSRESESCGIQKPAWGGSFCNGENFYTRLWGKGELSRLEFGSPQHRMLCWEVWISWQEAMGSHFNSWAWRKPIPGVLQRVLKERGVNWGKKSSDNF